MFCVNLCEYFPPNHWAGNSLERFLKSLSAQRSGEPVSRIYIGSSFCGKYFLHFSGFEHIFDWCGHSGIPVTICTPVFTEMDRQKGQDRLAMLCQSGKGVVDEITVNDYGMLSFLRSTSHRLNLGRLFFKDPRDARVPDYVQQRVTPAFSSCLVDGFLKEYPISSIELDPVSEEMDLTPLKKVGFQVGLHTPFCYMTTGNICKFASIHRPIQWKFRPSLDCAMECLSIAESYSGHIKPTNCDPVLLRMGRTLYFERNAVSFHKEQPDRIIYFPAREWRGFVEGGELDENTGSFE